MFFKNSKKKQLEEIKRELFLLRDGLGVQKEHAVFLAKNYASKEDFAETIGTVYDYMIEKVKKIEDLGR